jgi:Na+/proline symporter
MQERINELGRKLVMFAVAAVIIGVTGVVLSVPGALDGEWTSIASLVVGLLGIAAGVIIWSGANAGSALDGMNLGVLWALLLVPYTHTLDVDEGIDTTYPLPDFGAIFSFGSSTSVNGQLVREDIWGIGFLGVILLVSAVVVRKDWTRIVAAREFRGPKR